VRSYLSRHDGYYLSDDGGSVDQDGYGVRDGAHRRRDQRRRRSPLSTGQLEEVIAAHLAVAECAVIGVQDTLEGQLPHGFVVLRADATIEPGVTQLPWWHGCASRWDPSPR
jgi:propionyl-CoA synthetase